MPAADTPRSERLPRVALAACMVAFGAAYAALSLLRYQTFHSRTFDLAFYVRIVWGLGRGNLDVPLAGASYLGLHLEPALLPLSLLGRLAPIAPLLLVVQAAAVAVAPWPLYRLARRHLPGSPWLAVVASLSVYLYPTVTVATLFDFHPGTMALAPLLFALEALDRGPEGRRALVAWLLVALSLREDVALPVAVIGAMIAARPRVATDRRLGLSLFGFGLVWFFGYTLVVQPHFLPAHGSYDAHFEHFGHSVGGILAHALAHPVDLARYLLSDGRPAYPLVLLWPVAFLPLLAPRELLPAVPLAGINLLSSFPRVRTLEAHYATVLVPFLLAGAVRGAGRLSRWLSRRPAARRIPAGMATPMPVAVLACALLIAHRLHGDSPLTIHWDAARFHEDAYARAAATLDAEIPAGVSVRAPRRMVAHLAERPLVTSLEDSPPAPARVVIVEHDGLPFRLGAASLPAEASFPPPTKRREGSEAGD